MRAATTTIILWLLAGCAGEAPVSPEGPAPGGRAARVVLTEFAVAVDPGEAGPGAVSFEAENAGAIPHELVIVRTEQAADALPVTDGAVPEEEVTIVGASDRLERGSTEVVTVELEAGAYVLICNIAGHYQAGMRAPFRVSG